MTFLPVNLCAHMSTRTALEIKIQGSELLNAIPTVYLLKSLPPNISIGYRGKTRGCPYQRVREWHVNWAVLSFQIIYPSRRARYLQHNVCVLGRSQLTYAHCKFQGVKFTPTMGGGGVNFPRNAPFLGVKTGKGVKITPVSKGNCIG